MLGKLVHPCLTLHTDVNVRIYEPQQQQFIKEIGHWLMTCLNRAEKKSNIMVHQQRNNASNYNVM